MAHFFEVNNISYAHPVPNAEAVPALKNVSFSIKKGEYITIVGSNGSGKTTLARHLNALHVPNNGQVLIQGLNSTDRKNHLAIHQKVGMVFQHPQEQLVATSIEEDVAFGPENLGLPTEEIRQRVKEALEAVDLWDIRERSPQHLSGGQTQRVALAGVLAMRPQCIIFDEATAMLDPVGREDIYNAINRLHDMGITIITITHFMNEVVFADRVLAMHKGELVFDGQPADLFTNSRLLKEIHLTPPPVMEIASQLKPWIPALNAPLNSKDFRRQISGQSNNLLFQDRIALSNQNPRESGIVSGKGLSFTYLHNTPLAHQALFGIDFLVPENSIFGLIGSTGSGKSTLMQHINGLYQAQSGTLRVGPYTIDDDVDIQALRRYAGIVFQNPNYQLFEQYVGDEIAYGLRLQGLTGAELREKVREAMNLVGLDFETFKDRLTFTLSGGERRKVALASTIALDPKVLLLDEPTAGLDPASRLEIRQQILDLNQSGKTIVLSSHQMEDMANLTSQILMLNKGQVVTQEKTDSLLSNQELLNRYKMQPPIAAKIAGILIASGWAIPKNITTSTQLIIAFQNAEVKHG